VEALPFPLEDHLLLEGKPSRALPFYGSLKRAVFKVKRPFVMVLCQNMGKILLEIFPATCETRAGTSKELPTTKVLMNIFVWKRR